MSRGFCLKQGVGPEISRNSNQLSTRDEASKSRGLTRAGKQDRKLTERRVTHPFAITTIANGDAKNGERLKAAIIRGEGELFPWGIGADLSLPCTWLTIRR